MKKHLSLLVFFAFAAAVMYGIFGKSNQVFADGGYWGSGGGPNGGTCAPAGYDGVYNDTCYGATWRYYTADSDSITVKGTSEAPGITVENCKTYGGGYYILGLEAYNPSVLRATKNPEKASLGYHIGVTKVNKIKTGAGIGAGTSSIAEGYKASFLILSSTEKWGDVYGAFQSAQDYARNHPEFQGNLAGQSWEETTYFCWNKDNIIEEQDSESKFSAWSFVGKSYTDYTGTSVDDGYVEKTFTTQNDKFTVYFQHQFSYKRPTVPGIYDPAHTAWRTEVTIDGQKQDDKSVNSPTTLNNPDSGPGGNVWWSDILGKSSVEVDVPETGDVKVCSKVIYKPKNIKWKKNGDKFTMDNDNSSSDEVYSEACAIISREEVESEEAGQIRFISQSTVHTDLQDGGVNQGGVNDHTESSDENGNSTVTLYLATTKDHINVDFWHSLKYLYESQNGGAIDPITIPPDKFENAEYITTHWTVSRESDKRPELSSDNVESGDFKYADYYRQNPNTIPFKQVSPASGKRRVQIEHIDYGETVKVCEKITFSSAIFPLEREEKYKHTPTYSGAGVYYGQTLYRYDESTDSYTSTNAVYHYGITGKDEWGSEQWGLVSGAVMGESVYGPDWESLYERQYVPVVEEASNQTVYIAREASVPKPEWGEGARFYYTAYSPSSIYHYEDGRWQPGYKEGYSIGGPNGETLYELEYTREHDYWIYRPIEGADYDEGFSEACIVVTRPEDPYSPGDEPGGIKIDGPSSGDVKSGFMYAGETTDDVEWDVAATSYATRRVMEAKAIVYEPTVNVQRYSTISKGNLCKEEDEECRKRLYDNDTDPCVWYSNKASPLRTSCQSIRDYGISNSWVNGYSGASDFSEEHISELHRIIDQKINAIIPDYVGDKYCNSFGYKMAYWWGVTRERNGEVVYSSWQQEGKPYWAIYDAACRTIAKKPSLNLWNGSLFTNGNVSTSIATRYYNYVNPNASPLIGTTTLYPGASGSRYRFGSWSEYLAVVGGSISSSSNLLVNRNGFGSGTALSYSGYPYNTASLLQGISPLTISNASPNYGNSGVEAGSTFRARLSTYLGRYLDDRHNGIAYTTELSRVYKSNNRNGVSDTIVVNAKGQNIEITDDIIIADGPYASIYQLPQIIIFADDITIDSSVTRIDAWLIATGKINTCAGYESGKTDGHGNATVQGTPAHVKDYNDNNLPVCSNQLTINGPIVAGSIELNRSYGADPITDTDITVLGDGTNLRAIPGEAFNLSADTFLWAYAQAGRYDSSYTEAYTRELPPRY